MKIKLMTKPAGQLMTYKKSSLLSFLLVVTSLGLNGCGGGGGAGAGASTSTLTASRYSLAASTTPSSVFYGGASTTLTVKVKNNCATPPTTTGSTTDANKVVATTCGTSASSLDSVSGKVVNIEASDPKLVSLSTNQAITDANGVATVTINAPSADVSGMVSIKASVVLSSNTYDETVAVNINSNVDRTISSADNAIITDLGTLTSCSAYPSIFVNVKNANGTVSTTASASVTDTGAAAGLKDLGAFPNLGKVFYIQPRPTTICADDGDTDQVGNVTYVFDPNDGSAPYTIGYVFKYKFKKAS